MKWPSKVDSFVFNTSLATFKHKWLKETSEAILVTEAPPKETKYFTDIAHLEIPLSYRALLKNKQILKLDGDGYYCAERVNFGKVPKGICTVGFIIRDTGTDMLIQYVSFSRLEIGDDKDFIPCSSDKEELSEKGLNLFLLVQKSP